ncbi:hypothetical protein GIY23_03845 [Allosaccharopolyspora coralli]|uniref:Smu12A n=1 Tax=Allosaccharopolyspora coralli TaxID=2665642 RepID=A0A5Q3Q5N4_9PSEU|nr:hypothetical protein [Allosaccharopolyspora coralli]QGK68796.1 hypothetical protein GIY23_03845 [Allosaccharopolyspora coralli]
MRSRFQRVGRGRGPSWTGGGPGAGERGRGRPAEPPSAEDAHAWFTGRLPDDWFTGAPAVTVDKDEILVVGTLPPLDDQYADEPARAAAEKGRVARFREDTRDERVSIARQAEHRYDRKVAWGARIGGTEELFTTLSVPVMTRLRQPERAVLDTLVDAGVARSRSDALAWSVRLVGEHTQEWLAELREAMSTVDELRRQGPRARAD